MKVAVVGAGISGLTAAHVLARTHEVTIFEAAAKPGGHTNTIRVDTERETHFVDTGFIVLNDRNYPNFECLLARLGVVTQPSDMSFSVSDQRDFEYASTSASGLFANRRHLVTPSFLSMVAEVRRFQREARGLLDAPDTGDGPSLGDWLEEHDYSQRFIDRLIVPQASAVWSADPRQMWTFPARFLAEFFHNHGMLTLTDRPKWRTVAGGSQRYVDQLVAAFGDRLRLASPVTAVARHDDHVMVTARGSAAERFDQVVLATHSDQALKMLEDPSDRERELLGAIAYQPNEAVLHTDERMLPRRRAAWASWNYHLLDEPRPVTTVTYHMNRLQALTADREFCVTLNRTGEIDPAKVIETISYAHPVFTREGHAAQARHHEISGTATRTHYAGAYWGWGFHEDGVVSALKVTEAMGAGGI
jgi:predicted NAD/FAD-binding protein